LEHWKALIEENKTYILYNYHVFDNDIAFKPVDHPFKVVFGSCTKVHNSFKEIQDEKFKTDVLYGIVMCFNLFLFFSNYKVLINVIFLRNHRTSAYFVLGYILHHYWENN